MAIYPLCKLTVKYSFRSKQNFMLRYCFILLLAFAHFICYAQNNQNLPDQSVIETPQNFLNPKYEDTAKVNLLIKMSTDMKILGNYDSALLYAKNAQVLAQKIGFGKGLAEAFRNSGVIYYHRGDYQKAMEYQYKSLIVSQYTGYKKGIASAYGNMAIIYYTLGNYSKALEYDFKSLNIIQESGNKDGVAILMGNIGIIYDEQENLPKALEYQLKSLELHKEKGNKDEIAIDFGNIGYTYFLEGDYSKALEYDLKAVSQAEEIGDKDVTANFLGDIGNIYYTEGIYSQALDYDFKALTIVRKLGNKNELANLFSNTGGVYLKLKNYGRAKIFLDSAIALLKISGDKKYIKNTYSKLAALDSATGNYKTAYADYKQYIIYRDSIINQESLKKIMQLEITRRFEKREDSIKQKQEKEAIIKTGEINKRRIINNSIIIILLLAILVAILLINRQQIKHKKDKIIFEKETHLLLMEKHRMENELANAKAMLDDYIKNMVEKNRLLEQFKTDIDELKKEADDKRIERLEHLNKTTILTDEDWNKFKELFGQVHKDFFNRLKEKLPDLTKAEVRLICLTKLQLGTKQMAGILGVSVTTIEQSRYRLRKKLNLSKEDSLSDVIEAI